MKQVQVLFDPQVDAALLDMIDYVDPADIPTVLNFLEAIQTHLVQTLSTFPEGGSRFQGNVRMKVVEGYVFLYEYHPDLNEVHVLSMEPPGRNWR